MKFDVVRAWKDEAYRLSLSREQLNALPANPAGELNDADLNTIFGGGGEDTSMGSYGASSASASSTRNHSYGLTCDINAFSLSVLNDIVSLQGLLSVLSPETQCCASRD